MQEFPIKKTQAKVFQKEIVAAISDIFGISPGEKDGKYEISYGALARLTVWACGEGKTLCVDSVSRPDAPDDVILDTNRKFREYLQRVTGYTAQERVKMAKKKVIGE